MNYLCNDLKYYLDAWPSDQASRRQKELWPHIRYEMLGTNRPGHIRLLQEEGYDGQPVFSVTQSTINKILNPVIEHPLYPKTEDLVRFAAFMHLHPVRALHMVLKMNFEKALVRSLRKRYPLLKTYYSIQEYPQEAEQLLDTFHPENIRGMSPESLHSLLAKYYQPTREYPDRQQIRSIVATLIEQKQLLLPNNEITEVISTRTRGTTTALHPAAGIALLILVTTAIPMAVLIFLHTDRTDDYPASLLKNESKYQERIIPATHILSENEISTAQREETVVSPVIEAAGSGDLERVHQLIRRGADVNAVENNGRTALMAAAKSGHYRTVRLLLENGARVDAADRDGQTALMDAIRNRLPDCAVLLLEYGADPHRSALDGRSALTIARENGYTGLEQLLSTHPGPATR